MLTASFKGEAKAVRDLLKHRCAYVDVCDSRGFTALHLASYCVHSDVVNILLDFGANVNQLTDDGLTPLTLAFLLYYANESQQAMEAVDDRDESKTSLD